jgi:hypothetical protein
MSVRDKYVFYAVYAQGAEMIQIIVQSESSRVKFLVLVVSTQWSTLIRIMQVPKLNLNPKEDYPYVSLNIVSSK